MSIIEIPVPLAGESHGMPVANQEQGTSGYMLNCRPRDVLEGRFRIGQRPGLKKAYSQQIGGATSPIKWMGHITVVNSAEGASDEAYSSNDDSFVAMDDSNDWLSQTFTTTASYYIGGVGLKLYRVGLPGQMTVSIYATSANKPTGDPLVSGTIDADTLTTSTSGAWYQISLSNYQLSDTTKYAIVLKIPNQTAAKYVCWRVDASSPSYTGGNYLQSEDGGVNWTTYSSIDAMFIIYKGSTSGLTLNQYLIAAGNNEIWYDSTAGTMTELTAANGDIDTNGDFEAVPAYQKIFITNGGIKRILDLANTKINTTNIGSNLPNAGNTLTGGTSNATMIVDYIDASSSACNVYGFRNSQATFLSGETVTGTNDSGNAVSFTISANETAPPHWYPWKTYADDTTTYGTMLSKPTLACLYRGRIVVSGDTALPHAWQMTKVGMPFKVLYDFTNDGDISAVTYTNTKVGLIGDIIVSLTAYKDDLLIFGCANSIWILVGDPLADGQLAQVTKDTGIWGPRAWTIDGNNNFYFLGNDGIYMMPISESFSAPQNISKLRLPNLIKDWDLDKSLHRVTLSYDPINYGILVSRTLLSDGTNTNYWYDLTTGGFFSESYPTSCGIFSSYFYPATDETYKKFLIGGQDGYIREFDNSTKNDTTTSSTSAIDSYFASIVRLGEDEDSYGLLRELTGVLAGGAANGDFTDSDSVTCSIYDGDDAETTLEDIKDGATAFTSVTWSSTGKSNKSRPRMRGIYAGLKLRNNTASETWGLDKLYINVIPKGKR